MKTLLTTLLLGGIAILSIVTPATAATYVAYHCDCTPAPGSWCWCTDYHFQLGYSQTKEFRAYCTKIANYDIRDIVVSERDKNTTCTITVDSSEFGYTTKSCTNWSWLSRDNLKIDVGCKKAPQ